MYAETDSRSLIVRFFDNFLQERNIKWVLSVGMLILFGSSLMLVYTHWQEWRPEWKYLLILGYTSAIYWAGRIAYERLTLQKTGTALMALTVLLIPISFMSLQLFAFMEHELADWAVRLALLATNLALSQYAARKIFDHFLRGAQPTFLFSYLGLSLAGAIVPSLTLVPWTAALTFAILWAIFTAGTVKVNRHVFWLVEEYRAPRIFGFFPIGLLAVQFIGLFGLNLAYQIDLHWLGLGCVLTAVPVLLTADTLAKVFIQRTGNLIRPLPWSIILPIGIAIVLCAGGISLSASELAYTFPYSFSLVPTGLAAGGLMAVVARRTGKQAFVWAMLFCLVIAYQFTPAFFKESARVALQEGAAVIQEQTMPIAFYGLTYLPLLGVLTALGFIAQRKNNVTFSSPIQGFASILPIFLLAMSLSHFKAMFPVGLGILGLYAVQAVLYKNRLLLIPSLISVLVAALGFIPFSAHVLNQSLPMHSYLMALIAVGTMLAIAGRFADKLTGSWPGVPLGFKLELPHNLCQLCGLFVSVAAAIYWIIVQIQFFPSAVALLPGLAIGLLLALHALRWNHSFVSDTSLIFANGLLAQSLLATHLQVDVVISLMTIALLGQWIVAQMLAMLKHDAIIRKAYRRSLELFSAAGLSLLVVAGYLPGFLAEISSEIQGSLATELPELWAMQPWILKLFVIIWAFDAAHRWKTSLFSILGCGSALALIGSTVSSIQGGAYLEWLPAIYAGLAFAALPGVQWLKHRIDVLQENEKEADGLQAVHGPLNICSLCVLIAVALFSMTVFSWPMRIAGGVSLCGLVWFAISREMPTVRSIALCLISWQVIFLGVQFAQPEIEWFPQMMLLLVAPFGSLHIMFASAGLLVSSLLPNKLGRSGNILQVNRVLLRAFVFIAAINSWGTLPLDGWDISCATLTVMLLTATELWAALQTQKEDRVWWAMAIISFGTLFFWFHGIVEFGRGLSMFALAGAAFVLQAVVTWADWSPRLSIFARPFHGAAYLLPMLVVAIGMGRHLVYPVTMSGLNSLALLMAAGFYFWQGIEQSRRKLQVISAAILNISLALLWRELAWTDPQLFMIPIGLTVIFLVELLKEEIAEKFHTPLRYAGALCILVSPTFYILGENWLPMVSLMGVSVLVILLAIGLRLRPLLYTGTAFLIADLFAMIIRAGIMANPNFLWIAGLFTGGSLIALAAICENHREIVLQRLRMLSSSLESWE